MSKPYIRKPPYPAQFREQMIELVRAGRKPGELAKEFGCHVTSILNWIGQADGATGVVPTQAIARFKAGNDTSVRTYLSRLYAKLGAKNGRSVVAWLLHPWGEVPPTLLW